jgi:hypothetical protein
VTSAVGRRFNYYRRIFGAYLTTTPSQLSFWHENPAANPDATPGKLGPYYMSFASKADYAAAFDSNGIPLLDYRGALGRHYNPIAIAQYGLANYNLATAAHDDERRSKFLRVADWLIANLEPNQHGVGVWNHHFDWDYRTPLRAPWYSALAQGQGISLLARAASATDDAAYADAARRAFAAFEHTVDRGGVVFIDAEQQPWLEEYIVDPPTHILNGFMWALWGVYDYWLLTQDATAGELFRRCTDTLRQNLASYDTGFWSLYEHSGTRLPMLASPFYHRLHIVQLHVMSWLTDDACFTATAERWQRYAQSSVNRKRALLYKSAFKLIYY